MSRNELITELQEFGFKTVVNRNGELEIFTPANKNTKVKLFNDKISYQILDATGYQVGGISFSYDMIKTKALKTIGTFCISTIHSTTDITTSINLYTF